MFTASWSEVNCFVGFRTFSLDFFHALGLDVLSFVLVLVVKLNTWSCPFTQDPFLLAFVTRMLRALS